MSPWEIFVEQFVTRDGYLTVLSGLLNTVIIAVFGLLIGFVLGALFAVIKSTPSYKKPVVIVLQKIVDLYVAVFRGTPMVVQLLIMHFIFFPAANITFGAIVFSDTFAIQGVVIEAVIAFGLNSAAYVSEIMRGGINSVDKGQLEAARALGLSYPAAMLRVVVPQAVKNIVPTLGNEFIALIKDTSVAGFISVIDLTRAFQNMANSTYEFIVPYLMLAVFYLVIVVLITIAIRLIERRFAKSDRRVASK